MSEEEKQLTVKQRLELMPDCNAFVQWAAAEFDRDLVSIVATENGHTVKWSKAG